MQSWILCLLGLIFLYLSISFLEIFKFSFCEALFHRVPIVDGVFHFLGIRAFTLADIKKVSFASQLLSLQSYNIFSSLFNLLPLGDSLEGGLLFFERVTLVSVLLFFGRMWWAIVFYAPGSQSKLELPWLSLAFSLSFPAGFNWEGESRVCWERCRLVCGTGKLWFPSFCWLPALGRIEGWRCEPLERVKESCQASCPWVLPVSESSVNCNCCFPNFHAALGLAVTQPCLSVRSAKGQWGHIPSALSFFLLLPHTLPRVVFFPGQHLHGCRISVSISPRSTLWLSWQCCDPQLLVLIAFRPAHVHFGCILSLPKAM